MNKAILESVFRAMITMGGSTVFDKKEQSNEYFSLILKKSNEPLDKSLKRRVNEIIEDGYFMIFSLYKFKGKNTLETISKMLATRVYNEIFIREDVAREIFDSLAVAVYESIGGKNSKIISTHLENQEEAIISLLNNFGFLQDGMLLLLQCEKNHVFVGIKIKTQTIIIGRIPDDVVTDYNLINSYSNYNCILKRFNVYENKKSEISVELNANNNSTEKRDIKEINQIETINKNKDFSYDGCDENIKYSATDINKMKNMTYDYNSDCDHGMSSDYGYYDDEYGYSDYNIEDMVDYSEDADDYIEYLMDQ
ncbi:MAG TPA: hypothetical protein DEA28_02355 [Firmicutes bacterium]|nr:hypothetical protein [Bacillota bacterium]